ncbi:hypothetical protein AO825_08425 [Pectobacterium brasiliense]|uniref:hypothetical protein n=1 Tax=Pectobacterium brasiliense TaxID=180957 RepID=UPI0001A444D0|nr:hypothetical protein [Pectobacterium brasiliense]KRF62876.1 hypothetical protein AO825_08425 [Pectobacterium brasiliense]
MSEIKDIEYEIVTEKLFDFSAGAYCGVLMPEHVMKKLAKLQNKHLEDVKRILTENKNDLYVSGWTLHHPKGVQKAVYFADTSGAFSVEDRIRLATVKNQPIHRPLVFKAKSMDDAESMANAHFNNTSN